MADDAEYLLQVQVGEMQQIGERLRSKLRTLWANGTPTFAETFAEVWPQLPAGLRSEMTKRGATWYVLWPWEAHEVMHGTETAARATPSPQAI